MNFILSTVPRDNKPYVPASASWLFIAGFALRLLKGFNLKNKVVLADKAYAKIHDYLEKQGAIVCIPDKINAKSKHDFDRELYKKRNVVERFFCRLKRFRRIFTRYDKLSIIFAGFILLAMIIDSLV